MEDWTRRGFLAGAGGAIMAGSAHGQDGTDADVELDTDVGSGADADTDITEGFDAGSIDDRVAQSLEIMQETHPFTTEFLKQAAGVLIMPLIGKGGVIFSGSYGEGALRIGGQNVDYYTVIGGSIGFQIGGGRFASALFFMTEESLDKFRNQKGWTAGADLQFTALDEGESAGINTATAGDDVFGLVYDRKGLELGVSIDGAKYTRVDR